MEQLHATTVQFIAGVIKCFVVERIVVKDFDTFVIPFLDPQSVTFVEHLQHDGYHLSKGRRLLAKLALQIVLESTKGTLRRLCGTDTLEENDKIETQCHLVALKDDSTYQSWELFPVAKNPHFPHRLPVLVEVTGKRHLILRVSRLHHQLFSHLQQLVSPGDVEILTGSISDPPKLSQNLALLNSCSIAVFG